MRGAFSVGAGAVTVTVTVTVFSGAFASSRAQAALNPTIVRIAAAPAVARRRRVKRSDLILFSRSAQAVVRPRGSELARRTPSVIMSPDTSVDLDKGAPARTPHSRCRPLTNRSEVAGEDERP